MKVMVGVPSLKTLIWLLAFSTISLCWPDEGEEEDESVSKVITVNLGEPQLLNKPSPLSEAPLPGTSNEMMYESPLIEGLSLLPPPNRTSPLIEEEQLALILADRCPYLKTTMRPVRNYSQVINITAKFQMVKFGGIQENEQRFTIFGFLIVFWKLPDGCTQWAHDSNWRHIWRIRPTDFPWYKSIPLWYPVIWQPNNAENVLTPDGANFFLTMYLDQSGTAGYDAVEKYVSHCDMTDNIKKFPFDVVTCSLSFQTWSPTILVSLTNVGYQADHISTQGLDVLVPANFISQTTPWRFVNASHSQTIISYGAHKYTRFEYAFTFQRKPLVYIVEIFLPINALFFLILCAFAIPARQPERPQYALAVVMSYFLLLTVVSSTLPESSEPTLVSIYLICQLGLAVVSTGYFGITNQLALHPKFGNKNIGRLQFSSMLDLLAFLFVVVTAFSFNVAIFSLMTSDYTFYS